MKEKIEKLGNFLFRYRSFTPILFILVLLFISRITLSSILLGLILVLIGLMIRFICAGTIGAESRGREVGGEELVTGGPFAFVRNPIYLGNLLLSSGFVFLAIGGFETGFKVITILLFIFIFFLQYFPVVHAEENFLRNRFGEEYENYYKSVPRFFPKLKPYRDQKVKGFNSSKASLSEKSTFITVLLLFGLFLVKNWLMNALNI
jgi:protein-S-isoprenylcysteine O-methyltransferase Ste14